MIQEDDFSKLKDLLVSSNIPLLIIDQAYKLNNGVLGVFYMMYF